MGSKNNKLIINLHLAIWWRNRVKNDASKCLTTKFYAIATLTRLNSDSIVLKDRDFRQL